MTTDTETDIQRGRAAFQSGDHAAAEACFRRVLAGGRDDAELRHYLGFCARARADLDAADTHYSAALELAPTDAHMHNNLGETRRSLGRFAEAVALFRRGLALAPDAAPIAANLGALLLKLDRPDLALQPLQRAAELDPAQLPVFSDLAVCLCSLNRYEDALPVYRHIYQTQPSANDARYLEALALLALGDFENGWRKHEVRWHAHLGQAQRRRHPGPYWLGNDDLTGRTILVHAEQGFGDTVQCLRYIPLLRQLAGRVVLQVQPNLKPMLAGWPDVFARDEDLPAYDYQCSFMSLPRAFQTIPPAVPYLTVPPDRLEAWRVRLGPGDGRRRVAIAWTGASAIWNRSVPFAMLEPLLRRPDCEFHLVQTAASPHMPGVIDHSAELTDFADTAAIVGLMDMVISVDTVLAHLGGALAKPVCTLLPFGAEYRWLIGRDDSPWYPTMRLFRQPVLFDWPSVIGAVNEYLG